MANKYLQYTNRDIPQLDQISTVSDTDNLIISTGEGSDYVKRITVAQLITDINDDWTEITYANLATLKGSAGLTPGQFYYITDKHIAIQALSTSELSVTGYHTRAIQAYGWVQLDSGSSGSVDSITVNSVNIMSSSVSFNTDLVTTAGDVVSNINANTSSPNYSAVQAANRIIILAEESAGSTPNGYVVSPTFTSIGGTLQNMSNGQDVGDTWFNVVYLFDSDLIVEMADDSGNSVKTNALFNAVAGYNPIDKFPWGYSNIFGNIVEYATFTAYAASGNIIANRVQYFSTFNADAYLGSGGGSGCNNNLVNGNSQFTVNLCSEEVYANVVQTNSSLNGTSTTVDISNNQLNTSQLNADSYGGVTCQNNILHSSTLTITNGTGSTYGCIENQLNTSTLSAAGLQGDITYNIFETGNATLTSNTGDFNTNILRNSTVNASSCSGDINSNQLEESVITINGFTGTKVESNILAADSLLNGSSATSDIYNNTLSNATLNGDNSTGVIKYNSMIQGSTLDVDTASGTIEEISLINASTLDLNSSSVDCSYVSIDLPDATVKFNANQSGLVINAQSSNYNSSLTITSNAIDLDADYKRYTGIVSLGATTTLNTINGLTYAPDEFIILGTSGTVTIDSASATNISLPGGVDSLDIKSGDFIKVRKNTAGTMVSVFAIYTGTTPETSPALADGTASLPSLSFLADSDTGLYRPADNEIGITVGGSTIAEIKSSGLYVDDIIEETSSAGTTINGLKLAGGTISPDKGTGTESSNAVTINNISGVITTSSLSTAAGGTYSITLTNSTISAGSEIIVNQNSYSGTIGTNGLPITVNADVTGANTAVITIVNAHSSNALSGTLDIYFLIVN